jgi:hypothetical protein
MKRSVILHFKQNIKDLKKDHDILDRNYYQTKTKYDRLLQEKSRVTIEVVSSIPGNDFMWIENDIRYKVSVNGKAVKYLRGDPLFRVINFHQDLGTKPNLLV